jgi:hypothetical protein
LDNVDTGCLNQRLRIERLQVIADTWARDRVGRLASDELEISAALIVMGEGGHELTCELGSFAASLNQPIANLIPQQGIVRILREGDASAAALVASASADVVALQIADFDHEETLTARILRPAQGMVSLDKWDYAPGRSPLRLRQILRSVRGSGRTATAERRVVVASGSVARPDASRPQAQRPAAPHSVGSAAPARRNQAREMREELELPAAAAPSWLQ